MILRDPAEAQDATHDAFIQAWRKWSTLRDPLRFEAWFDRILVNACKDRLRRSNRTVARDISDELEVATPDPYTRTHERDAIEQALATLSPDHRVVVALRFDRDLTTDEIARRLDVPVGTVNSRLHYALRKLHDVIDRVRRGTEAMNDSRSRARATAPDALPRRARRGPDPVRAPDRRAGDPAHGRRDRRRAAGRGGAA